MKKFRTVISGYSKTDVNEFVKEVTNRYEDLFNKLQANSKEIEYLNRELEKYKNLEKTMNDTLFAMQETTANAQRAAYNEGKLIIEDAKNNASKIVNNSLLKAQTIEREAEELRRKVVSYKHRFIALIEQQMDDINRFDEKL